MHWWGFKGGIWLVVVGGGDISFSLKNISSFQYLLHHFMDLHNWANGLS